MLNELSQYLLDVVKNSSHCANCQCNHGDGVCFLAYECVRLDFTYKLETELPKIWQEDSVWKK